MRRLGFDETQRIDYRDFAKLVKPSATGAMAKAFSANMDRSRFNVAQSQQVDKMRKKVRHAENGKIYLEGSHVGPLKAFRHIALDRSESKERIRTEQ